MLPAERHAHEDRSVAVPPADRGRGLLVRDEAQERGGHRVPEGGERCRVGEVAADHLEGVLGQPFAGRELVHPVFDEAGVEVHARARLADRDLGREGHLDAIGVGNLTQHPLGQDHLVGRVHRVDRQELDLLLDHLAALDDEVSDLGVGVFDGAPHTHQVKERLGAHVLPLGERAGLVVAALRFDAEEGLFGGEEVILELAEGFEGAARVLLEGALCLA